MKTTQIEIALNRIKILAALAALAALPLQAGDTVRYKAQPIGSKVTIAGTSTAHDWTMEGQIIGGFLELPAAVQLDPGAAAPAGLNGGKLDARVDVSIPVASLKGDYHGMDEVMQQAMDAPAHPRIIYHLTEMTFKAPHAAGAPFAFDTKGDLIVNAVTNAITMPVSIENISTNKLKITGKIPLKMTDYKIKPPKLAILSTGDDVTIAFEWVVARPQAAKTP